MDLRRGQVGRVHPRAQESPLSGVTQARIRAWLTPERQVHSAASARASASAGWTRRDSTMSVTRRPAVTARAITEISSAAWRPTIDPPSTTPVAGSLTIFTNPRGSLLIKALADAENGTFVVRTLRPAANASA